MPQTKTFSIPHGMTREQVARTFAAYLLGSLVYEESGAKKGAASKGPYRKEGSSNDRWQLDWSNDYWLHCDGDAAYLACRYASQEKMMRLMVDLFVERHRRA